MFEYALKAMSNSLVAQESGNPIAPTLGRLGMVVVGCDAGIGMHQGVPHQLGVAKVGEERVKGFCVVGSAKYAQILGPS